MARATIDWLMARVDLDEVGRAEVELQVEGIQPIVKIERTPA